MAVKDERQGFIALTRFGFGPRGDGDLAAASLDARAFLRAELDQPGAALLSGPGLPGANGAVFALFAQQDADKAAREMAAQAPQAASPVMSPALGQAMTPAATSAMPGPPQPPKPPRAEQIFFRADAQARLNRAFIARAGLVERLVAFWSNHFAISIAKGGVTHVSAGAFEREAIRPFVLGKFGDMLLAVESHPAMLFYLDNQQSIGPDSPDGLKQHRGRNENLGREILELHTLGVCSGYTQRDVTGLAGILTGRSWFRPDEPVHGGEFVYIQRAHEPGEQTVLGKRYADTGAAQAHDVLLDLARHPATAAHVAQKFARHFVADEPPPALVAKLEKSFKDNDGDLRELARTLVRADESWTQERSKFKPPSEWIVGISRIAEGQGFIPVPWLLNAQASLGEPLWRPPAPNGFADTTAAWIDGVPRRLDIATEFAGRLRPDTNPLELLDRSLGPLASSDTRGTIARAESRPQAFALLVMAPEFLRR